MDSQRAPVCVSMPSATAAQALLAGDPWALFDVALTFAARAGFVAAGMMAVGKRRDVVRDALTGAAVIEASVLIHLATRDGSGTSLATQEHVASLLRGDASALLPIAGDVAMRSLEIAAALFLVGSREHLLRDALGGSLGVEALLFGYSILFGEPCPVP